MIPLNRHMLISDRAAVVPPNVARMMQIPEGQRLRRIVTVNYSADKPLSYSHFFFPDSVRDFIDAVDFSGDLPPISVIERRRGIRVERAEQIGRASCRERVCQYV